MNERVAADVIDDAPEDAENLANHLAADRIAKLAVEGLNRLAREKAARKTPPQAA